MIGHRHILLDLIDLLGIDGLNRIFLTVNRSLLQCGVYFCPSHGSGVAAKRLPVIQVAGDLHHADLQALHIGCLGYSMLGVRNLTPAILRERKCHDAALLMENILQLLADLTIQDLINVLRVLEQERQIKQLDLRAEAGNRSRRNNSRINGAQLQALGQFPVVAQQCAGIDRHFHGAARLFLYQFRKFY